MHRPAVSLLLAFLAGVAVSNAIAPSTSVALYALGLAMLLGSFTLLTRLRRLRGIALLICCAALGFVLYSLSTNAHIHNDLRKYSELAKRAKVEGIVQEIDKQRSGHLLIVDVEQIIEDSLTLDLHGRVAASLGEANEDAEIPLPRAGDTITFFSTIQPLRAERNPHAGSYDQRLKYHYGAHATAELSSRFDYYINPSYHNPLSAEIKHVSTRIRGWCSGILDRSISEDESFAFVNAVVLGVRGDLDEHVVLDFKHSGLTHLLAISGFNIAVVTLLIAQGLLLVGIRRRSFRMPITAVAVAFYCFVVGLEPSVLRAFIMVELFLLSQLLERKTDLANLAAITALIHLVIDPMVIHDAGFQLSYAAVFGFALIQPELMRLFEPVTAEQEENQRTFGQWLRHSLILSLSAFLATTPVLIYHFRQASLVVMLSNLTAIPLAGGITVLGFLLIPLTLISSALGSLYGDALSWMVGGLLFSSEWLAKLSAGGMLVDLSAWSLIIVSLALLWALRGKSVKILVARGLAAMCVVAVAFAARDPSSSKLLNEGKLSVVFADIGQGDATIVKTPSGKFYMFDFGPLSGSDMNLVARQYGPMLQVEGGMQLEAGFVTHLHRDHYGALMSAAMSDAIRKVYTVGDKTDDEYAYVLDSVVRENEISVERLSAGQILELDDEVKLYVLSPDASSYQGISNDRSLVLKLVHGNTSLLLLGDIEREAEHELVSRYGDLLESDVIKVAHHGSISSSTHEFVERSAGRYAVISCGRNNRFGHPHPRVVSRWMRAGAEVLRTDLDGAVIFESDGEKIERVDWRSK
jgi:competence protein ComEC